MKTHFSTGIKNRTRAIIILVLVVCSAKPGSAQSAEVQQLLLNYEKLLQLRNILADMKKGYELVSAGYNAVRDISRGNFDLHNSFLAGLKAVNPAVRQYGGVAEIIGIQQDILKEYKAAFNQFSVSDLLSDVETGYLERVYSGLFSQTLRDTDELLTVITASDLSMTDAERLAAIDRIHAEALNKRRFLRSFNTSTRILILQRAKEFRQVSDVTGLYLSR